MNEAVVDAGVLKSAKLSPPRLRIIVLASLGSMLEFYEYILYGVFSQYIATTYFPTGNQFTSLLATFGVFAVGYASRPLGGIILGHYGDRFGRRGVFLFSVLAMAIGTIGIAILPGYSTLGVLAPIGLVTIRFCQGLCFGGELACALTYVVEALPNRRGLVCGSLAGATGAGLIAATGISLLLHNIMPPDAMQSYGWRLGFLVGGTFGLATYWVRKSLNESPEFLEMKGNVVRLPLAETLRHHWKATLVGIGIAATLSTYNGLLFAHMPSYLVRDAGYEPTQVAGLVLIGTVLSQGLAPVAGWLSDLLDRRIVYGGGALFLIFGSFPIYKMIDAHTNVTLAFCLFGIAGAFIAGTFGAILSELFPTRVRFTGIGLTYGGGAAIFNGLAPLVATVLIQYSGSIAAPAYLMAAVATIGIGASAFIGKQIR